MPWKYDILSQNISVYFHVIGHTVLFRERGEPCEHLVNKDTQGPPVNLFAMARVQNNFWGKVVGSATKRERALNNFLGETEVD